MTTQFVQYVKMVAPLRKSWCTKSLWGKHDWDRRGKLKNTMEANKNECCAARTGQAKDNSAIAFPMANESMYVWCINAVGDGLKLKWTGPFLKCISFLDILGKKFLILCIMCYTLVM